MNVVARLRTSVFAGHPAWGMVLGFLIAVGDIRLTPVDDEAGYGYVGMEVFLMLLVATALVAAIAVAGLLRLKAKGTVIAMVVAVVAVIVGTLAAGAAVAWIYNSYHVPAARYAILPAIGIVAGAVGAALWFMERRPHAELILMAALTALVLVPYVQEAPLLWAGAAAVAATVLWLAPEVSAFSRMAGLALHLLALLAFVQLEPSWFEWTPFPFLTFAPLYIVAQYLRTQDAPREWTWWVGAVVSAGTAALGISTTIGNVRRGLPVIEPLAMLAGGLAFLGVFYWFWRGGAGPHKQSKPMPTG